MTTRLKIDGAGRVALPKALRKALCLDPGDVLELEASGEKIILRPVRNASPLAKEKGVRVFRTGKPLDVSVAEDVIRDVREQHDWRD